VERREVRESLLAQLEETRFKVVNAPSPRGGLATRWDKRNAIEAKQTYHS
jgi:hypothetical protein